MNSSSHGNIDESERSAFYKILFSRRDVRKDFIKKKISNQTLYKILLAAHHAPSVGYSQPWDFILVRDLDKRSQIKNSFLDQKLKSIHLLDDQNEKKQKYLELKLEGILESDLNICVTYDHARFGPFVIGRMTIKEAGIYSVCCAIQNLWLAARAENIGVGWVSILNNRDLKKILNIPQHIKPIAYLCLGYVKEFEPLPDLEKSNWAERMPLTQVVNFECWGLKDPENDMDKINQQKIFW
ncbi:MAG: 5,6-dimethylbenzimidazole synthase [Candidatus Nitrosocosmicus sp.]|nr:5,6-dimethylbenzimidazole synthase [Candidatus Nitrosocosmicus sp.]